MILSIALRPGPAQANGAVAHHPASGGDVLILPNQRLVFLEVPKTASTAIRRMLIASGSARDAPLGASRPRHINAAGYQRRFAPALEARLGGPVETFCVIREPLDRLFSWYRYRQRAKIDGRPTSTRGLSFADFIALCLAPDGHPAAEVGRQDHFVGYAGGTARVDHVFDYARLDLLEQFLAGRVTAGLHLAQRNISPAAEGTARPVLPEPLMAQYRQSHATEFALYDLVRDAGVLRRA